VFLDEVILDDKGGRMFVCSDSDYCEDRQAQGHRGKLADFPGIEKQNSSLKGEGA
jgi:alpha-D-ribose 1-methylphosphonate 5-phosphate C-P lyase